MELNIFNREGWTGGRKLQIKYSIINDKIVEDFHFIYFYEEQDKMEGRGG